MNEGLNETPIQRLQREWREYQTATRSHIDVTHKCVAAIEALNDLDSVRAETNNERFDALNRRCDAIMLLLRAIQTEPAEVAERMLRSVDDE